MTDSLNSTTGIEKLSCTFHNKPAGSPHNSGCPALSIKPVTVPAKRTIQNCARCGGDHEGIVPRRFAQPPEGWDSWAPCPTNGDPILIAHELGFPQE